ncbi:hypothetical protein PHJA_000804100 [Phtheirospermum japonicum]|uniref:S-protein homolog n=1 Tax=Phtheirospermum japonicum TaxID=374723 RepID=A0A830BR72_9LAMI|nr:hypothetical protein PHJA_000804100 [Phtheirospermum japonicum]
MLISSEGIDIFKKVRVLVQNRIPHHNITIHCWSSEDNLGTHKLAYNAIFSWHFRVNFWLSTKFVCDFTTIHGSGHYGVYDGPRARLCHKYCFWRVTRDGPCLLVKNEEEDAYCQDWQHPPN